MKTILMFPQKYADSNLYLLNLEKTISGTYNVVGVRESLRNKISVFFSYDVCHLNWIENINGKSKIRCLLNFLFRLGFVIFLHCRRRPVVWTIHNKIPHNEIAGRKYSLFLMKLLMRWSTRIHILCDATFEELPALKRFKEKVVTIPHGDYCNNFGEGHIDVFSRYRIPRDRKIIFFTGKIGPYKNLELLVKAFEQAEPDLSGFVLLICGFCPDRSYLEHLKKARLENRNSNVIWDFHFIPNGEMGDYLNQVSLLIAPYDVTSALNSGTVWMAFSYHKTIVCPRLGCVRNIDNADDMAYFYDYETPEKHLIALTEVLKKVGCESSSGRRLSEKGESAFSFIKRQSWESKASCWINLYAF